MSAGEVEWAGVAVRFAGGVLLTVQIAPVFEGLVDLTEGYDDVRAWGEMDARYRSARREVRVELRGLVTDDSHWSRWPAKPPPRELPAARPEIGWRPE